MSDAIKRSIFRWVHLVFGIPIIGYVYSPFKELPNYAPVVRYVAFPVIAISGLLMWKAISFDDLFRKDRPKTMLPFRQTQGGSQLLRIGSG